METSMGFQRGSATALSHFRGWESYVVFDDCPVDQFCASLWFSFEKDIGKGWKIQFDSEQMHLNPQKLLEALVVWTIHHPNLFKMPVPLLKVLKQWESIAAFSFDLSSLATLPCHLPCLWSEDQAFINHTFPLLLQQHLLSALAMNSLHDLCQSICCFVSYLDRLVLCS